uniref:DUF2117 domain-containing protein n=1 Tax=Candidatus Methanophagaceae archaeon ANME-1 ERB6 TaxID=2759912 RepID=A0A7G9YZK8_9EURY|nr:hypothetical protein HCHKDHBN_00013 [Methanosarcinales archaeon ANME-1 ERB6]
MNLLGLLIHGPEVIDEDEVEEAIETLKEAGFEVEAALGGITGKTAVIDAGMQHVIDISRDMRPSEVMEDFVGRDVNFILLLNHAKTEESGFMLGEGILRRFFDRRGSAAKKNISFVQLEYGSGSRIIIRWLLRPDDAGVYKRLTRVFSEFGERQPYKLESRCKKDARSNRVYREIKSVHPGEKIVVDGVVIGMVSLSHETKNNSVTLVAKEGKLVDVVGGRLIKHNLEKLPPLELEKALVKTASVIRRTNPKRIGVGTGTDERESQGKGREKKKKRACLFYNVGNLFPKLKDAEDADADVVVAVTIGDDTTSIAGDILKRFGIRMIGITDGDADGLIAGIERGAALEQYDRFLPPDSLIIRLKPERDDIIGEKVKEEIFEGGEEIELDGDVEQQIKALKHRILHLAEQDIIGELSSPPITTAI